VAWAKKIGKNKLAKINKYKNRPVIVAVAGVSIRMLYRESKGRLQFHQQSSAISVLKSMSHISHNKLLPFKSFVYRELLTAVVNCSSRIDLQVDKKNPLMSHSNHN